MSNGFKTKCRPSYRLLTDGQIQKIHQASLDILESIGVRVFHNEGIQLLEDAGCHVKEENIVQIPNELVTECIRSAPSSVTIYMRDGKVAMHLEGRNIYFGTGTDLLRTVDLNTGETRLSVLQDVANAAIISDYCSNINFIASFGLPSDIPPNLQYFKNVKTLMENSIKPIFFTAAGKEDLSYIVEMAEVVAGGEKSLRDKPFLIHYSEPTSPLTHSNGAVNKLLYCAEKGVPICYPPSALLGASCPVTLAGGIAQTNAEALSGIVLHQLKRKGAPIISGLAAGPLDMRTAINSYGAPEERLVDSAFADIYHYYEIPVWSTVGSDSHCLDQQAGMEHAFGILMAAFDGANLIHDVGYLGQGLLGNPASIVMCDEIIDYVKRIIKGFNIDRERIAMDVIQKVGPGKDFLAEEHTLQHFRQEIWQPLYLNREDPETWVKKGSKTYGEKVKEKAQEILKTHKTLPLSESILQKLKEIEKKAEEELIKMKFVA
ncbi:MAG: trimethylamine methyltransferase family protein [Promethearchaeota archaeon]